MNAYTLPSFGGGGTQSNKKFPWTGVPSAVVKYIESPRAKFQHKSHSQMHTSSFPVFRSWVSILRPRSESGGGGGDRNCIPTFQVQQRKRRSTAAPFQLEPFGAKSREVVCPVWCLIYLSASVRIGCYSTRSTLNFVGDSCRTNSNPFASLPMPITVFGLIANCFSSMVFVFQ